MLAKLLEWLLILPIILCIPLVLLTLAAYFKGSFKHLESGKFIPLLEGDTDYWSTDEEEESNSETEEVPVPVAAVKGCE